MEPFCVSIEDEMIKKITEENRINLNEEQWVAVEKLICALGVSGEVEVAGAWGEKHVFDKEEDRPLFTPCAIEHLAGLVKKPLADYGLDADTAEILETIFSLVKKD